MEQELGILKQRMQSVETGLVDFRGALTSLNTKIDERFTSLSTKLDERSRTPWGNIISACGVTMGVVAVVGSLAMSPIRDNISEINADYKYLTRSEVVPRSEHLEKWRGNDQAIDNIRQRIISETSNIQRQVDELRNQYNATYGARDIILDMKDRLNRLELETAKKS